MNSSFCFNAFKGFRINRYKESRLYSPQKGTEVFMVFDFFRKRAEEGINQVQNIATKTIEGKLGEALLDSATYLRQRQRADAENWKKITAGLSRSRDLLLADIGNIFGDGKTSSVESQLEMLEEVLLRADLGTTTTNTIISDLRQYTRSSGSDVSQEDILTVLRSRLIEALSPQSESQRGGDPAVILVIGANGMGKTTTIGKLAYRIRSELNQTVLLGACDTFRAAAVNQLQEWAVRANVSIETPLLEEEGGDPVLVANRTLRRGKAEGFDVIILDTSGRLSNNYALTVQLQEIRDAVTREIPSGPHEILLVVDGSVGRNAVLQAETWRSKVGVSGLVVTKLDGTARGGFVVSVVKDLGLPVKLVGVGEGIEDLRDFEPETFVDALLGNDEASIKRMKSRAEIMLTGSLSPSQSQSSSTASFETTGRGGGGGGGGGGRQSSVNERLRASFGDDDSGPGGGGGLGDRKEKTLAAPTRTSPRKSKQQQQQQGKQKSKS
eukprot:gene8995-18623_t